MSHHRCCCDGSSCCNKGTPLTFPSGLLGSDGQLHISYTAAEITFRDRNIVDGVTEYDRSGAYIFGGSATSALTSDHRAPNCDGLSVSNTHALGTESAIVDLSINPNATRLQLPGVPLAGGYAFMHGFGAVSPIRLSVQGVMDVVDSVSSETIPGGGFSDASFYMGCPCPNINGLVVCPGVSFAQGGGPSTYPGTLYLDAAFGPNFVGFIGDLGTDIGDSFEINSGVSATRVMTGNSGSNVLHAGSAVVSGSGDEPFATLTCDMAMEATAVGFAAPGESSNPVRFRRQTASITATVEARDAGAATYATLSRCPSYTSLVDANCGEEADAVCCDGSRTCSKKDSALPILVRKELHDFGSLQAGLPAGPENIDPVLALSGLGYILQRYPGASSTALAACSPSFVEGTEPDPGGTPSCDPTGATGNTIERVHNLYGEDDVGPFALAGEESLSSIGDAMPSGQRMQANYSLRIDLQTRHRDFGAIPAPVPGSNTITANLRLVYDKALAPGAKVSIALSNLQGPGLGPGGTANDSSWWRNELAARLLVEGQVGGEDDTAIPCASFVPVLMQVFGSTGQAGEFARFRALSLSYLLAYTNLAACPAGGGAVRMPTPAETLAVGKKRPCAGCSKRKRERG